MSKKNRTTEEQFEEFTKTLKILVDKYGSDLRIGQIIYNAISGDPFYVENDLLISAMRIYANREE